MKLNPAISSIVKGVLFWWVLDFCLLLAFACAIEMRVLPIGSAQLLALVSVILTSSISNFFIVKNSGSPVNGYCLSGVVLVAFVLSVFCVHGLEGFNAMLVKVIIAVFVGTIFGNLLGMKRHYKLKNSPKKRKKIAR